jgi:dihydroflavonol-4-reductase
LDFDKDHRAYENIPVEIVSGSVLDSSALDEAMKDVQILIHSAAFISLERKDAKMIRMVNVEGTRKVCEAALKHKIKKMIHFSSVDCF